MQEVNLYQLLKYYATKWPWILFLTLFGALAGYLYTAYLQTPLYKSDATLLIIDDEGKATKDPTLINNYIELIKSRRVLEPVIEKSNHALTYDQFAAATTATNEKDTEVVTISVATKDAQTSKRLTEGLVTSLQDEIKNIYDKDNVTVVDKANLPDTPFNVNQLLYLGVATSGGFFLAILMLFFAYDFKQTRATMRREASKSMAPSIPHPEKIEAPVQTEEEIGAAELENQLGLPMPPALDTPALPQTERIKETNIQPQQLRPEKHSLARRTMRTLVGLTLEVPERPIEKDDTSKETT